MSLVACLEKVWSCIRQVVNLQRRGCVRFLAPLLLFQGWKQGPILDCWEIIEKYAKPCKPCLKNAKTASSKSGVFWNRQGLCGVHIPSTSHVMTKDIQRWLLFPGFSMPFQSENHRTGWWMVTNLEHRHLPIANINLEGKSKGRLKPEIKSPNGFSKRFTVSPNKSLGKNKFKKCLRISERSIQWVMMPGELVTQPQLVAFNCHARRQVNLKPGHGL